MSYNGSGTFNINTAGQPVVTGTTITSTAFNLLTADLATGLSTALTKDGQSTPTANIPMGAFKITGLGAGTAATDAAQYGQLQAGATTIATVTGTDTYVGTLTPAIAAYATGNLFSFVAPNTNTGAATINLNSLGAKNITKLGSTALAAGDIVSGRVYQIEYDGTRFQLLNPSASTVASFSAGSTGFTPSTATTGAVTLAGTLATTNGGTGLTSFTANGVVYASSSSALATGSNLTYDGTNLGLNGGFLQVSIGGTQAIRVGSTDSIVGGSDNNGILQVNTSKALLVYAGGSERARIDTSGNFLVGTSSLPSGGGIVTASSNAAETKVSIVNTGTSGRHYWLGSTNTGSGSLGAGKFAIFDQTGNEARLAIDSSGNVGINSTSMNSTFVVNSTGETAIQYRVSGTIRALVGVTSGSGQIIATSAANDFCVRSQSNILFSTNGDTERCRIDTSGLLLLGKTSATTSSKLEVDASSNVAQFHHTGSSDTIGIYMRHGRGLSGFSGKMISFRRNDNTEVGSIVIGDSLTTYNVSSDYRLKNSIAPMTGALAKVALLKPCTYKWNSSGSDGQGFIAHELAQVVPDCVTGEKDAVDENGDPKYQGIDTSFLVATLTAAIQEQQAIIESLKARLDAANL